MAKCQVVGCTHKAEYYDEFSGHCGDSRRVRVKVCGTCLLGGWCLNGDEDKRAKQKLEILEDAERIDDE